MINLRESPKLWYTSSYYFSSITEILTGMVFNTLTGMVFNTLISLFCLNKKGYPIIGITCVQYNIM